MGEHTGQGNTQNNSYQKVPGIQFNTSDTGIVYIRLISKAQIKNVREPKQVQSKIPY